MAHTFPKRIHVAATPIDHTEVNDNLRDVASEIGGRVNEHNVKAGTFSSRTDCETNAILEVDNGEVTVDPALNGSDGSATGSFPGRTFRPSDSIRMSNNGQWETLTSVEKSTGNSLLWVIASWQQQLMDDRTLDAYKQIDMPGPQYAIRIDGFILDETVLGSLDTANDVQNTGIVAQAMGLRTDAVFPVTPGYHQIDLVARSTPDENSVQPISTDILAVYNREIIVLTLDPANDNAVGGGSTWVPITEGSLISASVVSAPFNALQTDINGLPINAVQTGALHAEHVTGVVIASGTKSTGASVTHTYTNRYPGWATSTIGSPGWNVITDGTDALSMTFSSIDLTDTTICGMLVFLNVNVVNVEDTTPTVLEIVYACISIQVQTGGSWVTVRKTERYTNAEVNDTAYANTRKDLALATFLRLSDVDVGNTITGVRAVVSGISRDNFTAATSVTLQQCNLSYAVLQAG